MTGACAGLLGVDDVSYGPEGPASEAGAEGAPFDGAGDSTGDGEPCSTDLSRDPEHCGSCTRRCGDGRTCADGLCAPELVLSGLSSPNTVLRVAGTTLVSTGDGVFRCAATGCGDAGEPLLLANAAANEIVTGFAADDAGMTVGVLTLLGVGIPAGRVVSCPLGACASPRVLAPSEENLQTVARSDVDVLWGRDSVVNEELVSCPAGSCDGGSVQLGKTPSGPESVTGIAPRGASILWMVGARLYETHRGGGTTLIAAIGTASARQPFVRDGDRVYWGNAEARLVEQCDVSSSCDGTRALFVPAGGTPRALAVDSSHLYVAVDSPPTDGGSIGFVGRAPRTANAKIEVLAKAKAGLRAITVDAAHVYWAEDNGMVWRVAK